MAATTYSILRADLPATEVNALIEDAIKELERLADLEWGNGGYSIRDLLPTDLPGYTNNEFTETSSTDNTWTQTTAGDATAIADDTILCLWGLQPFPQESTSGRFYPVTAMRITIGAALRAQWSLYNVFTGLTVQSGTAAGAVDRTERGYFMSPLFATKTQVIKIEEYNITASAVYIMVWLGAVAEKSGRTLQA